MKYKYVAVSEDTYKRLLKLKIEYDCNFDEVVKMLLDSYEASGTKKSGIFYKIVDKLKKNL